MKKISVAADQLSSSNLRDCTRRIEQAAAGGDFAGAQRELIALRAAVSSLDALTTS